MASMTKKKKQTLIYFAEGETEQALINALKDEGCLVAGKFIKFNLWQNSIKSLFRRLNKQSTLIFVIDTDITNQWDIFRDNIKSLKGYDYCIFVQNRNLEEELVHCCAKRNLNELVRDFYGITSISEFKTKLVQDRQLAARLRNQNFNHTQLWCRPQYFERLCHQHQLPLLLCKDSTIFLPQDTHSCLS